MAHFSPSQRYLYWTSIEVLGCLSLLVVLTHLALANFSLYKSRVFSAEALVMADDLGKRAAAHYYLKGKWAGSTLATHTDGEYIESIEADFSGALHVTFSDKAADLAGKILSFRPAFNAKLGGVLWLCGYATTLPNYPVSAENRTNVLPVFLPKACRKEQ